MGSRRKTPIDPDYTGGLNPGETFTWCPNPYPEQPGLFRALAEVSEPNWRLFLEGVSINPLAHAQLRRHRVKPTWRVKSDYTKKPAPGLHMQATYESLNDVARAFEAWNGKEVADHVKLYDSEGLLMAWHDIGVSGWPLEFGARLDVAVLKHLRRTLKIDLSKG